MNRVGTAISIRDWQPGDVTADLRALLAPERSWHDTNGPYFGRPSTGEMTAVADQYARLSHADPASFPTPREHPLPIVLNESGAVVGTVSWYWDLTCTGVSGLA